MQNGVIAKSLGGGSECVSGYEGDVGNGLGLYRCKVTTDSQIPRTLKANSCGFITLASSAPLIRFTYTASTEPSASYSLASLPEQPSLLCRNGIFTDRHSREPRVCEISQVLT